jgi:signal recognition particle subunit SRP54
LEALGARIKVPFFGDDTKDSLSIVKEALRRAREEGVDVLIIDTSGRLHVDEETMRELMEMKEEISPEEILLVTDATAGQDAVFVATTFDQALNLTGILLTKLDSDTRGGVALSIKMVTGKPIKFVGVGEEVSDIEPFYPERMANRILGMGDVLTLIEQVERVSREESKEICVEGFNLEDFLRYLRQIRKIGSFTKLLEMLPSEFVKGQSLTRQEIEKKEKELISFEAIINSMTREERRNPRILNGSRRRRIALGSGTTPSQVNKLLKHFDLMKKFMKDVKSGRRRVRLWGCKDW